MTRMINEDSGANFDRSVQSQYVAAVSSVAVECGLSHLATGQPYQDDNNFYEQFSRFSLAVQGEVARIRIRNRRARGSLSVQLVENTRTKIQHYVTHLREIIDISDLHENRKAALCSKLDDFSKELEGRRLNFGKAMLALSVIVASLGSVTTVARDGHEAITHILRLIGVDKQSEESALRRLAPPQKALPAPIPKPTPPPTRSSRSDPNWSPTTGGDLDDDIPF